MKFRILLSETLYDIVLLFRAIGIGVKEALSVNKLSMIIYYYSCNLNITIICTSIKQYIFKFTFCGLLSTKMKITNKMGIPVPE